MQFLVVFDDGSKTKVSAIDSYEARQMAERDHGKSVRKVVKAK